MSAALSVTAGLEALDARVNALAIDTTSDCLSLALLAGGRPVASHYALAGRRVNRTVLTVLDELLAGAGLAPRDLDVLLVARGPGSFTGTRIGMAVALTMARVTGRPLLGVDTLHLLAAQTDPAETRVFHALLNCARDEVYHAPFRWSPAGRPEALDEIRLADAATARAAVGAAPVVLRRFPAAERQAPDAFAGLTPLPLRHPFPDGLCLLAVGVPRYLDAPQGPFGRVTPLYLKSEAFRTWRPAS